MKVIRALAPFLTGGVAMAGSLYFLVWISYESSYKSLAAEHPGDPSIGDSVAWQMIIMSPVWVPLFIILGLVVGIAAGLLTRNIINTNAIDNPDATKH